MYVCVYVRICVCVKYLIKIQASDTPVTGL